MNTMDMSYLRLKRQREEEEARKKAQGAQNVEDSPKEGSNPRDKRVLSEKGVIVPPSEEKRPVEDSGRKEPFPDAPGTKEYETVDQASDRFEYGGDVVEEKKEEESVTIPDAYRKRRKDIQAKEASKRQTKRQQTKKASVTHIKEIPTSVFAIAGKMFPLLTKRDAVVAYLLVTSDETIPSDVSNTVFNAVNDYRKEQDDPLRQVARELRLLQKKADETKRRLRMLELTSAYILADRLGYRKGSTVDPEKVEILEENVTRFLERLRRESLILAKREDIREGRPKKE